MRRRTVIINSVLGVAVVGVAAATALSIGNAGARNTPTGQTVAVERGTVTSTVSAAGNIEAASSVSVAMTGSAGGTVKKIYVKEGQKVAKGDRLLEVSDTSARQSLKTAEATLASAEAQLKTATQGRSTADQKVDDASVDSARTGVTNARTALSQARETLRQDKLQQQPLVSSAEDSVDDAEDRLDSDEDKLAAAKAAGDQSQIPTLESTVASDRSAVTSARSSLKQARQSRDKTLLLDRQAIQTQEGQVESAEDTLSAQKTQRAANAQPPRRGAVESAEASVDSAQVSVDQAKDDLANTVLHAPVAGTVVDVSAVVGQSSSAAGESSSAGTSSASATGTTSSAASSASSSGLVTLASTDAKQVSASVAEADVVKVKAGQLTQVQLPASGRTLSGRVTSVAAESSVTDNVVQYAVTVSIPTAGPAIRLGQTADVTITTSRHDDALFVPTSALTSGNGHSTVTRRVNGTDSVVEVRTGLVGSVGTEILAGLDEGDVLVLPTGSTDQTFTFPGGGGSSSSSASPGRTPSRR